MTVEIAGINLEKGLPLIGISLWNIIVFIVVLAVGIPIIKLITKWTKAFLIRANAGEVLAEFTSRVTKILLYITLFGIAVDGLGIDMGTAFISISVVLGFVLGFALGDTLSNIAAGFMIAITRPFNKGDYVTIGGESGVIKSVGISLTELDTIDNKHVIIPNKLAWGGVIVNYTRNRIRRVDMEVGVSYSSNLNQVIETTLNVLKSDGRVLDDPAPQVAVKEMADSAIVLVVRPWCKTEDYWDVFFDTQKALKEAYDSNDIEIPFPQMDVHLSKE